MAKHIKRAKTQIGLSPYIPTFVGKQKLDRTHVKLIDFTEGSLEIHDVSDIAEIKKYHERESYTWVNIDGLHDAAPLEAVGALFSFDPTIIPQVMNTSARPIARLYDNAIHVSARMLIHNQEDNSLENEIVNIVAGSTFLVSFREQPQVIFQSVLERIQREDSRIRKEGVDYLLFVLLDVIVDSYGVSLSELGDKISTVEDELLSDTPPDDISDWINKNKRELSFIKRTTKPMNDAILNLLRMDTYLLDERAMLHIKELWNNMLFVNDELDRYRDVLADQLDLHNTNINNELNDRLSFLTIFSVIFIPLTFIAGIYGTNFDYIPELGFKYAYFIMWGVMVVIAGGMVYYFKSRKWF